MKSKRQFNDDLFFGFAMGFAIFAMIMGFIAIFFKILTIIGK